MMMMMMNSAFPTDTPTLVDTSIDGVNNLPRDDDDVELKDDDVELGDDDAHREEIISLRLGIAFIGGLGALVSFPVDPVDKI